MFGQIELIDYLRGPNPAKPRLSVGMKIYIRELDTVRKAAVTEIYPVKEDGYGYYIKFDDSGHGTIWEEKIGETAFLDEESALIAISKLHYEKFDPAQADISECIGYEYTRKCDGRKLNAVLAKVGDQMVYEGEFLYHHFLKSYRSKKERDSRYAKLLSEMMAESRRFGGTETNPEFKTLYKVGDVYAERGYAVKHL